jgi:hypothetical protein
LRDCSRSLSWRAAGPVIYNFDLRDCSWRNYCLGEQIVQTFEILFFRIEQPLHHLRVVAVRVERS